MKRLIIWNSIIAGHSLKKGRIQIFNELDRLRDKLAIPDAVIKESASIHIKAEKRGLTRGSRRSIVTAACVYAACRKANIARTIAEFSSILQIERNKILDAYNKISMELNLDIPQMDPRMFITKFAHLAGISDEKIIRNCATLLNNILENKTMVLGKEPLSFTCVAIYAAAKIISDKRQLTLNNMYDVAGLKEGTVIKRFNEIRDIIM